MLTEHSVTPPSSFTAFVLGHIRYAHIKARILVNEIAAIGSAVKGGLITPESAVGHLNEIGAGHLLTWGSS